MTPDFSLFSLGLCTCLVFIATLLCILSNADATRKYPPGPKPLPLIANLGQVVENMLYQWLAFTEWGKQFGDIIHLSFFGYHIVVLNSMEAATDLLEKRSSIYSSRPELPMIRDLVGWKEWAFSIMDYGPVWRQHRRLFHQHFNQDAVHKYYPVQTKEAHKMLLRLLSSPQGFRDHIKLLTTAIILRVVYNIEVDSFENKYVKIGEDAMEGAAEAGIPGSFLVDISPILKYVPTWMPGASFKRKARRWRIAAAKLRNLPLEAVKSDMTTAASSVAAGMLHDSDGTTAYENVIANACAIAYAECLFLAMALYPEVQLKAQAELDTVVGPGRLPEFSDRPNLPYVEAVVKEILRWQPVTPLAIVHLLTEDDEYRGYHIPRGAMVMGNSWAILHNEREYADPHTFNPEHFLKDGQLNPGVLDPERAAFGFGRRICPGRHLAIDSIFIVVASVLCTFNVSKAVDDVGQPIPIEVKMTPGLISEPEEFKCSIKPRFDNARAVIEQALDAMQ